MDLSFTCRGPREQSLDVYSEPVNSHTDQTKGEAIVETIARRHGDDEASRAVMLLRMAPEKGIKTVDDLLSFVLEARHMPFARLLDKNAREPCGADLTSIVEDAPNTGEIQTRECPDCGQSFSFIKPEDE